MGKNNRHKKHEKKEKSKVKLKATKTLLPKGQNITNTSFKVKKIVIREQLRKENPEEPLSRKKLNIKELLAHLQHHNMSFRQNGLTGLKELLTLHLDDVIRFHLTHLIEGVSQLVLDPERDVRKECIKLLRTILSQVSPELMAPVFEVLQSYLNCAMTHIKPSIQEDSLLLLDALLESCPVLIAANSHKLLQGFLDMISNLRAESKPGRTLSINLGSKLTSVRWRVKVLSRLNGLLNAIVREKQRNGAYLESGLEYSKITAGQKSCVPEVVWNRDVQLNIPVFSPGLNGVCLVPGVLRGSGVAPSGICDESKDLQGYMEMLMPLLFETWLEIAPTPAKEDVNILPEESAVLLQCILAIIQLMWDYMKCWEAESRLSSLTTWFKSQYEHELRRHFLPGFPYAMPDSPGMPMKKKRKLQQRQELQLLSQNTAPTGSKCVQQNLSLCHLLCCMHDGSDPNVCQAVVGYVKRCLGSWDAADDPFLSELERVLQELLVRQGETWPNSRVILKCVISRQTQASPGLAQMLFRVLCDIVLQPRLQHLHSCPTFVEWLALLPSVLCQTNVSVKAVDTLTRLACQGNEQFLKSLQMKLTDIISNLGKVNVTGASKPATGQKAIVNILFWAPEWDADVQRLITNCIENQHWDQDLVRYVMDMKDLRESKCSV